MPRDVPMPQGWRASLAPESARRHFLELWKLVRHSVAGRAAVEPRIWRA